MVTATRAETGPDLVAPGGIPDLGAQVIKLRIDAADLLLDGVRLLAEIAQVRHHLMQRGIETRAQPVQRLPDGRERRFLVRGQLLQDLEGKSLKQLLVLLNLAAEEVAEGGREQGRPAGGALPHQLREVGVAFGLQGVGDGADGPPGAVEEPLRVGVAAHVRRAPGDGVLVEAVRRQQPGLARLLQLGQALAAEVEATQPSRARATARACQARSLAFAMAFGRA
jgi:hypothetical protein